MDAAVRGASTPDLAPSIAAKLGKLIGSARTKLGAAESAGHGKPALKARRASRPDPGWTGRAGSVNTSLRRSPTMANERIISADSHVNPPKELWTSRAPAKFRERAPRVESTPQGDFWIVDSQVSGGIGLDASAGHKPEEFRPVGMTYKDMRPGSYDPKARLADMDLDGVDAEVLYFGGPVTSLSADPELRRYIFQSL